MLSKLFCRKIHLSCANGEIDWVVAKYKYGEMFDKLNHINGKVTEGNSSTMV